MACASATRPLASLSAVGEGVVVSLSLRGLLLVLLLLVLLLLVISLPLGGSQI
jgi:hypothetical protein